MLKTDKILEILKTINPEGDFENSNNYISDGLIDSLGIISIVGAIEKEYGIKIEGKDVIPANFASSNSLSSMVERYIMNK